MLGVSEELLTRQSFEGKCLMKSKLMTVRKAGRGYHQTKKKAWHCSTPMLRIAVMAMSQYHLLAES